jgi:hypothetical protein
MEEDDLRSYFGQFGTITDLVRMTDKATGKRRSNGEGQLAFLQYLIAVAESLNHSPIKK